MAHESFEQPEIAALMNRLFINIKVDREERPDLDTVYQQALAVMGQQGGWPLTMFLTPTAEPFWGGTYFPPEPRHGRPGMRQILSRWPSYGAAAANGSTAIGLRSRAPCNNCRHRSPATRCPRPRPSRRHGRWRSISIRLWRARRRTQIPPGTAAAPDMGGGTAHRRPDVTPSIVHTLARISQGGIYDHLGGGYARYAVDAYWLVPHFEKMLYDNAQLLELLGSVWAATGDELFAVRAAETVGWLRREMLIDGAFASAARRGQRGRGRPVLCLVTRPRSTASLGSDAPAFRLAYGVTPAAIGKAATSCIACMNQACPASQDAERLARNRESC